MMILFFCALSIVPVLVALSTSPSKDEMKTYHPKPLAWMLKPVPENHVRQMPTPKASSFRSALDDSNTYFMVHTYYSAAGGVCDYAIQSRVAYVTNRCFATSPTTSGLYQCNSDTVCYYYEYSDDICYNYLTYNQVDMGYCKTTDADDDGYVSDTGVFLSQKLTAQLGPPSPLPGTSITMNYYPTSDCNSEYGIIESRQSYPYTCYSNFDGLSYTSTMYVEPNQIDYSTYGCNSNFVSSTTPVPVGECFVASDFQSSNNLAMIYYEVPVPTQSPSDYPTVQPTIKDEPSAPPTDYPTYFPTTPKVDYDAIVGTTVAGFSAMAVINTLLFFFQPPQDTSSSSLSESQSKAPAPTEF